MSAMFAGRLVISCLPLFLAQDIENKDFARDFKCVFDEKDFSTLEGAQAQWVPDTPSWDTFQGQIIHTEPHPDMIASADGILKVGYCQELAEQGVWHVQRVGPFRSRGNYDWWRLAWGDVWGLDQIIHGGQGVGVKAHWMGPVDMNGNVLGLPPIHVHHVHVTPGVGGSPTCDVVTCVTAGRDCCDYAMAIEHHGDFELPASEGGNISFGTDYGKYTKRFYRKMWITCELNDVRPKGSAPLEWWYQVAALIERKPQKASDNVLSEHTFYSPGPLSITSRIGLTVLLRNPANEDTFHYHTQRWPFSGTLVQAKPHSHQANSQQMLLFKGSPEQLGLGEEMHRLWKAHEPILTKGKVPAANFEEPASGANNEAMIEYVLRSMESSQKALNHNSAAPRLLCRAIARMQTYPDGLSYDRAMRLSNCSEHVHFSKGDQWTVLGFNGNASLDASKFGPATWYRFPQHHSWILAFVADDGTSHFTFGLGSVNADSTGTMTTWMDMVRSLLFGYPKSPPNVFHNFILEPVSVSGAYFLRLCGIRWSILEGPPFGAIACAVTVTSALLAAACASFRFVWRRKFGDAKAPWAALALAFLSTTSALIFVLNVWVAPTVLVITNEFDFLSSQTQSSTTKQMLKSVLFIAVYTASLGTAAKLFRRSLGEASNEFQTVDHSEGESSEIFQKRPKDNKIGRSIDSSLGA